MNDNLSEKDCTESKVVLIDLDNTLFDNLKARHNAIAPALQYLNLKVDSEDLLRNYEEVVELSAVLEFLGLTNYKHIWNNNDLYAILTILYTKNKSQRNSLRISRHDQITFLKKLKSINKTISQDPLDEKERTSLLRAIRKDPVIKGFFKTFDDIRDANLFNVAYYEFENHLKFVPRKGAKELIKHLKKMQMQVYVVTEGFSQIQKEKIKKLGLQDIFRNKVLTTEDASVPAGINKLNEEIELLKHATRLNTEKKRSIDALTYFSRFLEKYNNKSNRQFYSRVIHAIQKDPENPERALRNFAHISGDKWPTTKRMKLAMIGDRYDKDILPLINLFGSEHILTIRLRRGKHKNSYPYKNIEKKLRPTSTVSSFREIEKCLFNLEKWEKLKTINMVPMVSGALLNVKKEYLEIARLSDIPILKKIHRIYLNEKYEEK